MRGGEVRGEGLPCHFLTTPKPRPSWRDAAVTPDQVRGCQDRLTAFLDRYLPRFYRAEQRANATLVIRDRLAGLALQAAQPTADEQGGVVTLLAAAEEGQVATEGPGEPVSAASDGLGCQDGVGQDDLGIGVFQERHGSPPVCFTIPIITSVISKQ
jgi:hypothetical protein